MYFWFSCFSTDSLCHLVFFLLNVGSKGKFMLCE